MANVLIQVAIGHTILWIACRHHVCELLLGAVWKAVLPRPSKAPADALCAQFSKHIETHGMLEYLDSTCPHIFKENSPFFKERRKEVMELKERLEAGGVEAKSAVTREDYQYLWELIEVTSV